MADSGNPVLLLLPGLDGTARLFEPLLGALPDAWPQARAELRHYPPRQPMGYDDLVAGLRAEWPEAERVVIVAESFGGPIAVRLAEANPPGLQAVALCATFVRSPLPWLPAWLAWPLSRMASGLPPPRWLIRRYLAGRRADPALVALARDCVQPVSARVLARRVAELLRVDVRQQLARTTVPVLDLRGRRDHLVRLRCRRHIVAARPDTRCEMLDTPHMLLQTAPAAALRLIRQFVEAHPPPQPPA